MAGSGAIKGEGLIPAVEDGLTRLAIEWGPEARGCVEMMSGAIWVKDQLELAGSEVEIAHARKARDIAPLACKTDKVDARVLAELCRRELVPAIWVGSPEDRAIRERLRRRMHLVKLRTSARNRIFGLLDPVRPADLVHPAAPARCDRTVERRRVPAVWRDSIAEHLDQISELDRRIAPIARELDARRRGRERGEDRRSVRSRAFSAGRSWSATPGSRRGSTSRASVLRPGGYRRPARAPCAGPRSRPRTRPGESRTRSTGTTCASPSATAATRRSRRSPASS